jgi:parvulin-like peptidyl-prolyl isomerase
MYLLWAAYAAVVATTGFPWNAEAARVDGVVATVDSEVVLYSEVVRDAQRDLEELRARASTESEYRSESERILESTLNQAIESKLLYREAQLVGMEVAEEMVENRIKELRDLYPTNEAFMRELDEAGESMRDFRERTRKRLMAQRMALIKIRQLETDTVVSQDQLVQYYDENVDSFRRPERVRVRQIFLQAPEADPLARQAARARLELVLEELDAGADFSELAKQYSEAPGAEEGGIIGWQRRGDLIATLETEAFRLDTGEYGGIVESPGGLHILKVDEHQEAGIAPLKEVRNDIEPYIRSEHANKDYEKWIVELRSRSRVRVFL